MRIVQLDPTNWQDGRGYRKNRLLSADELRRPGALLQVVSVPAGSHIRPHSHRASVEVYIIRRGVCELVTNGQRHMMRPGEVILMEPGDVHELSNRGEEPFELWVFKTNATEGDTEWEDISHNSPRKNAENPEKKRLNVSLPVIIPTGNGPFCPCFTIQVDQYWR